MPTSSPSGTQPPLVFITGASSGIGQALATRYAAAGWRLALVARRTEAIESWAIGLGLPHERWAAYGADVSDVASIVAAGQACLARQGVPEVVIANAGISVGMDTAEREDIDVMARTFATNNTGMAATFHPFVDAMRERARGRLVGIASVAAIRGLPGHGAYCASKAAVVAYCESLRGELRGSGVQVVTLLPGYIDTPLTRQNRYPMPFLMAPEAFADRAFRAIDAGDSYRVIPWQMGVVAKLLRALPNAWFDRLLAGRPRKHRQGQGRRET
ncbi:MAG TPA: SDR family oxidoreductase [Hydrogenophaga sp.]|uniref:SDR family oxidoreductase n=1 Tax=Hydrogenophaga sp. TaxID=1904254 RepID=UPI002BE87BA6|nr:SDR family oxidoreductase [Hydrogenophaga sp.]HMN92825.1 SDR family oxidoreductase [Hydrogenophaga sp.]HMP10334.1 SDR family oxidoreductase [Hydrogenophaga sp.]